MKKLLELLNNNQLDELRVELTKRLLKQEHKSPILLQAIKNYFKKATQDPNRPVLQTVQHDTNGTQFICDGFSLYYFTQHIDELDALPQSTQDTGSINPASIVNTIRTQETPDDTILAQIKNIKTYVDYAKSQPEYNKKEMLTITLNNIPYQTYIIEQLNAIIPVDTITHLSVTKNGMYVLSDTTKALILPVRTTPQDFTNKFNNEVQPLWQKHFILNYKTPHAKKLK